QRHAALARVYLAEPVPVRLAAPVRAAAARQSPPQHCLPRRFSEKFGDRTHRSSSFLPYADIRSSLCFWSFFPAGREILPTDRGKLVQCSSARQVNFFA